jgi:hypothetical protein
MYTIRKIGLVSPGMTVWNKEVEEKSFLVNETKTLETFPMTNTIIDNTQLLVL